MGCSSPFSRATEPVGGYTTESVTHGRCDARPTVTFLAKDYCHCPFVRYYFEGGRLSRPKWPVTYQDRSPISVLTGIDVE